MKLPKLPLAGTLLLSYSVYTAFVPVSIAHSIILFSLAALFGFDRYCQLLQLPSMDKRMEDIRTELNQALNLQKETYEAKLAELKSEQSRQAIDRANASASSSSKKRTDILF